MPAPSPDPATLHAGGSGGIITESSAEVSLEAIREGDTQREVKKLGIGFWIAVGWLAVLITLAVLAPVLPFIEDPNLTSADALEAEPFTAEHWMGGDDIGRDVFSRVIWGARVSLFIGVAAVAFGFVIGGTLGLTAGFYGGRFERVVIGAMDIMLAFPALVLALGLITFLSEPGTQNASLGTVTLVLTIIAIPALARITRAATLSFSQREFVTASRALGARNSRIIAREILPNVIPPMAAFALIAIAIVIVAEGALSFLGLSVASPTATWGNLIEQGRQNLDDTWWISLFPCGVMFLTLLSFNYVGDQLRRYFDVKEINL
ncbi:MAG: ABC transporter permease [Acidimicrobiales bacterium]